MVLDDFHCKSIQYDKLFISEMGYIDYHYWKASGPYKERQRTCIDGLYALEPLLGNSGGNHAQGSGILQGRKNLPDKPG